MKAALNGVPSLSIMDGWWIEGCIDGVTGWAIGSKQLPLGDSGDEIVSLYDKLARTILPMFYGAPSAYGAIRRSAIALNASSSTPNEWWNSTSPTLISMKAPEAPARMTLSASPMRWSPATAIAS